MSLTQLVINLANQAAELSIEAQAEVNKASKLGFGFDKSVARVLKHEGGYVNHPNDKGGATNMGITQTTANNYKHLWSKYNWDGNMKTLPVGLAKEIYKLGYWDKVKGDHLEKIHPLLADHLFDFYVTSGGWAVKQLQEGLNLLNDRQRDYADIGIDGALGSGTLNSLRAYAKRRGKEGVERLILMLVMMQANFYLNIARKNESQESFVNGWVERTAKKMRSYVNYLEQ